MDYINANDFKVSCIGFGTHLIGGKFNPDYSDDEKYIKIIREAISLGVNHIDTSEVYGEGHCEEIIGKAISVLDRDNIFLASKVWSDNLSHDSLFKSLNSSLSRLGVDYIDLYYIHYPNPKIDLKDTMLALKEAKDLGLIKNIGVSNFSKELLIESNSYCKVSFVQNAFDISDKSCMELFNFCQDNEIIFVAFKPFGKGSFFKNNNEIINSISVRYNKTPAQVMLNWLIAHKNLITIPRVSSLEHLKENIGSCGWKLNKEDFDLISNSFLASK